MSYVAPYVVFFHALRASGVTVTTTPAAATDRDAYFLYDGRARSFFQFTSSGANSRIDVDRGAGTLEAVDTLIIPSGHNLGAQTVTVTAGSTTGLGTTLDSFTSAPGQIVRTLTSSTHRYLRVTFTGTGQWSIGECWIGRKRQPAQGLGIGWRLGLQPNYQRVQFDSGVTGGVQLGPGRMVFSAPFSPISGSDYAILSELRDAVQTSGARFWLQAPDSSVPLTLVELASPMVFQQINAAPANALGPVYSTTIEAIEALG